MENVTSIKTNTEDIISLAIEKIKEETKNFTNTDSKAKAVSTYVSNILQDFCKQDERFAEVIYKFKRSLSDCCADVMKGVKNHISDIDVYRGAVKFYFPNSEISMNMTIDIIGEAPGEDEILKEVEKPKEKPVPKPKESKPKVEKLTKPVEQPKPDNKPIQLSLF